MDAGSGVGHLRRIASDAEYNRIQRAYRAYIDHGRGCPVCAVDSSVCTTAGDLWNVYREAHEE
ncbi:hypothetical protein [Streptomyces sp. CoH27]|uniref:hypothetical protein n=1 Tax=Streptomyces sp. CoH27 TaxID=2875763 RepID=UPI001CD551BC|nr:hypothetical protein [Streptomyces sp. CoH27]